MATALQRIVLIQDPNYNNNNSSNAPCQDDLEQYFACRQYDNAEIVPTQWWKQHETVFPSMAKLTRKYLSIPAASVASERMFSTAGNFVTDRRNCSVDHAVSDLIFSNLALKCLQKSKTANAKK